MKNTHKGGIGIVLVIVTALVLIGIGLYFSSRTPANMPTTDTATSTSEAAQNQNSATGTNANQQQQSDTTAIGALTRGAAFKYYPTGTAKTGAKATGTFAGGTYTYPSTLCDSGKCGITLVKTAYANIDGDTDTDVIATFSHTGENSKTEQEVMVFRNEDGALSYVGTAYIGGVPAYTAFQANETALTLTYNTVYAGAAGWTTPTTESYRITNDDLVKIQ